MQHKIKRLLKDRRLLFWIFMTLLVVVSFLREFELTGVRGMNMSVYALSYRYGFISRGVLGTLLNLLCSQFGNQYYSNHTLVWISLIGYLFYVLVLFGFYHQALKRNNYNDRVIVFLFIVTPLLTRMFLTATNFGRTDMFLIMLTIMACFLIVYDRFVFLVIPIGAVGMMIHQGYIFMFFNLIVALLLYRILRLKEKSRHKSGYYITILSIVCVIVVGLLFWLEVFSKPYYDFGTDVSDQVLTDIQRLAADPVDVNMDFINHELFGTETLSNEWGTILKGFFELLSYCILASPIMYFCYYIARKILLYTKHKWVTILLFCGALSILPNYFLKCDYGRWFFATNVYFVFMVLFMLVLDNEVVKRALVETVERVQHSWVGAFICVYYMTFLPFKDVAISKVSSRIVEGIIMVYHYLVQ